MNMIDREYRDEKAVKIAINKIHRGEYTIVENAPEEPDYVAPIEAESRNPFLGLNESEEEEEADAGAVSDANEEEAEEDLFEEEEEEEDREPSDEELMALEKGNLKLD
jgi:hypothetical protein